MSGLKGGIIGVDTKCLMTKTLMQCIRQIEHRVNTFFLTVISPFSSRSIPTLFSLYVACVCVLSFGSFSAWHSLGCHFYTKTLSCMLAIGMSVCFIFMTFLAHSRKTRDIKRAAVCARCS